MTPRLTYYKRYRMEADLTRSSAVPPLPRGFSWVPWHDSLIDAHAEVKHHCFRDELDARIFPSFATPQGCRTLMRAIRDRPGFCPQATWLVAGHEGAVGTVQGICDSSRVGAIQNVGVVPAYRGLGLGTLLLLRALAGFRAVGATRVYLEVTARNDGAVRLYRTYGFRCFRTIYKAVSEPEPSPVGMGI